MAALASKLDPQDFFYKNFNSQRTFVSTCKGLTLTQPKIQALKVAPPCANEDAKEKEKEKEKEKNTTIWAKFYGELVRTMSDYLLENMLV